MVVDLPSVAPRPRPMVLRFVYTVLILVVLVGLPWLAGEVTPRIGSRLLGWWPSPTLVLLVLGALVAGRVSYRWRDGLLLLIPIIGLFYLCQWAWRLSLLPYRDWPPRTDEAPYWRKVSHPARPGARLYLVDRFGLTHPRSDISRADDRRGQQHVPTETHLGSSDERR